MATGETDYSRGRSKGKGQKLPVGDVLEGGNTVICALLVLLDVLERVAAQQVIWQLRNRSAEHQPSAPCALSVALVERRARSQSPGHHAARSLSEFPAEAGEQRGQLGRLRVTKRVRHRTHAATPANDAYPFRNFFQHRRLLRRLY